MWGKNYTEWLVILLPALFITSTLLAQEKILSGTSLYAQVDRNKIKAVIDDLPKTTFRLTITHSGDATGTTFPGPGVYEYSSGQTVGISVATSDGVYFGGWSGDSAGSSEFIQVVMDRDKTVDARFTSTGHILNIYIEGEGGTTPGPFGNPHRYSSGLYIDITTYQTNPLWRFEHWEGDIGENDPRSYVIYNLLMDQDRNIAAVFIEKPYYDLTVEIIGEGNVSLQEGYETPIILTPGVHTYSYLEWTYIRCERIETNEDWKFLRWEGDFGDTLPTYFRCSFSMDKNRYIRCIFTNNTQVPNVVGITQSSATTAITKAWLTVGEITEICNDEYPSGYVVDQDPPAGTTVEINTPAALWVSSGPCPVPVPNVMGKTQTEAEDDITLAGLILGNVSEQCNDEVEQGKVINQNPQPEELVPPGSRVDIVLSSGPCPITVPNIVWQFQQDAETIIANAGLAVGIVTEQCDDTIPDGRVISQNPYAGTQVPPGTAINFTVSTGPCLVTVPNVVQYSQTIAGQILTSAGLTVGNISLQCHNSIRTGLVISQSPSAGEKVLPNSAVDLIISSGPCIEGSPEGTTEGEGFVEGTPEGTPDGEGTVEGTTEGNAEGEGTVEGTTEGISEGSADGEGTVEGAVEGEGTNEGATEGEGMAEGEGETPSHSADQNGDWQINLPELLRVIQFFNI
ncbi:MAG: PASTA domain-containing protein, partial [Candidatus Hydrogenedens sp.]